MLLKLSKIELIWRCPCCGRLMTSDNTNNFKVYYPGMLNYTLLCNECLRDSSITRIDRKRMVFMTDKIFHYVLIEKPSGTLSKFFLKE